MMKKSAVKEESLKFWLVCCFWAQRGSWSRTVPRNITGPSFLFRQHLSTQNQVFVFVVSTLINFSGSRNSVHMKYILAKLFITQWTWIFQLGKCFASDIQLGIPHPPSQESSRSYHIWFNTSSTVFWIYYHIYPETLWTFKRVNK